MQFGRHSLHVRDGLSGQPSQRRFGRHWAKATGRREARRRGRQALLASRARVGYTDCEDCPVVMSVAWAQKTVKGLGPLGA